MKREMSMWQERTQWYEYSGECERIVCENIGELFANSGVPPVTPKCITGFCDIVRM